MTGISLNYFKKLIIYIEFNRKYSKSFIKLFVPKRIKAAISLTNLDILLLIAIIIISIVLFHPEKKVSSNGIEPKMHKIYLS